MLAQQHQAQSAQGVPAIKSGRSGAHAVEFVLVSMVFFLLLIGIIEMSRVLMVCHLLNEAARRGARTGVIEGTSDTDVKTAVDDYLTDSGVSGQNTTVLVNDAVANASTANSNDEVTVQVTVAVSDITWIPGKSVFATVLHPAISPPPPTGTTSASSDGTSSKNSRATVPWPAMTR